MFESVVHFCSTFMDMIPLSFMLGFYVSFIAARWWNQFIAIPWPDRLMNIVAMYIPGLDEASRVVRRTLMRYLNLSLVLVLRSISMAVKRRFPTKEHLVEAGFMTKTELEMFQSVPSTEFNTFWIPCTWFINVLREARQECRITDSNGLKLIMEELNEFRGKCGLLWGYDWISIPLVYTQVVTMATYAFFVLCIFGRQNVNSTDPHMRYHRYDYYVPIFTILQLMFYMGLLKVAEQLINPFGDDDEDFELNWIIDRHMKVSYLGVDTLNGTPPPLVKDTYYNELDVKIPYTEASRGYKKKTYRGSVAYMQVPMEQQGMVLPDMSEEDEDGETQSEQHMGPRRPSVYSLFGNKGSNHRGASPSSSIINLDSQSVDSEWKSSLPNISAASAGAKNASGTLGAHPRHPYVVEMCKAEDDEIVLDEVVIDPTDVKNEVLLRSDSLKIPGTSGLPPSARPHTLASTLRQISPKIAPKFTREKLKSMFRKGKKFALGHPLFKMKWVTFSRDTKYDDDDETDHPTSLLDVHDPQEVKITLSTPELTETEKLMGVHPYQFIQHRTPSPSGFGDVLLFQSFPRTPPCTEQRLPSNEAEITIHPEEHGLVRSCSLPNISRRTTEQVGLEDYIFSQLKKDKVLMSGKGTKKEKKRSKRRKSPPAPPPGELYMDLPSDTQSDQEFSDVSTSSPRRNTLPQITVTRCDQKSSNHLDLAVTPPSSVPSSGNSSDTGTLVHHPRRGSADSPGLLATRDRLPQSRESLPSSECSSISSKGTKIRTMTTDCPPLIPKPKELSPSQTPKRPKTLGAAVKPHIHIPKPSEFLLSKEQPATAPAKPSTLTGSQILKKSKQRAESLPGSPTSDIPCVSGITDSPSFPHSSQRTRESPRGSPTPSSSRGSGTSDSTQGPISQAIPSRFELTSVVTDARDGSTVTEENLRPEPGNPPVPPPRPAPRRGSRGRK